MAHPFNCGGLFSMALKDTCITMNSLLAEIQEDMQKLEAGNKAAAQRIRTNTIRFEKVAKLFRKESIAAAKSGGLKRKSTTKSKAKLTKSPAKKKAASKTKAKKAAAKSVAKKSPAKKKVVAKKKAPAKKKVVAKKKVAQPKKRVVKAKTAAKRKTAKPKSLSKRSAKR